MSGIELVVLDVDGTLYDQRPLRRRMALELLTAVATGRERVATLQVLRTFRRHRERLANEGARDVTRRQYDDVAASIGTDVDEVKRAVQVWMHERPLDALRACRAAGIDAWLRDLRARGVVTAVLSDHLIGAKLAALDIEVDLVASAEDAAIDRLKPDPTGLRHLMAAASRPPSTTLVVGDRPERDGAIAERTGARFLRKVWRRPRDGGEVFDFGTLVGTIGAPAVDGRVSGGDA